MKIAVSPDVFSRHPGYRRLVLVATGITNAPENLDVRELLRSSEDQRREPLPAEEPRLACWREAMAEAGGDAARSRSSVEALVLRVAGGNEIPFRSTVVALINHLSLKYLVPCGAVDLDKVEGDLTLALAAGGEPFSGPEGPEQVAPGEVILRDRSKVIVRRWVWRQDQATMVTEETVNVAVFADLMAEVGPADAAALAEEAQALLSTHGRGAVHVATLTAPSPEAPLPAFAPAGDTARSATVKGRIRAIMERASGLIHDTTDFASWTLWDFLYRGVLERVIVREAFLRLLDSGERIKIYQGFDATTPSLHIGHLVGMRVLRWFQLKGHEVIFLVGDATGMVGDPSGKSKGRELLTEEQVRRNMTNWKEQAARLLAFDGTDNPVGLLRNSQWLHALTLKELIPLLSKVTTQRLLERDMFQERIARGDPLFFIETLYPLLQGYDSVVMDVNAELGGSDQLYNMLMGRDLVKAYTGKEKHVLTTPLLPGVDGRKMGKTEGNAISLVEPAFAMFDGVMKVNDDLMLSYFMWLTDLSWSELAGVEEQMATDPLAVKERLALEIVGQCRGPAEAAEAHAEFVRVRRKGETPREIPEVRLDSAACPEGKLAVTALLSETQPPILASRGEVRRMIRNRGVRVKEQLLASHDVEYALEDLDGCLVQIGKNRFFRIHVV